jgi:hypothetical protein
MAELGTAAAADTKACLNCGHVLTGPFCANCGQQARVHRSLRSFFGDFASGVLNFEGKVWHTIPLLAWKPGELTRRYIIGERARFVSPVALYLFTVFLMFAMLSFTGALGTDQINLNVSSAKEQAELGNLMAQRATAVEVGKDVTQLDRRIVALKEKIDSLAKIKGVQDGTMIKTDPGDEVPAWLRTPIQRVQRDPKGAMTNIQDATSKYSWLLIPLSVPFLWLLFPFSRRFKLYDHGVFVTYSLSFMMMLVIVGGALIWAGLPGAASMLSLLPPFHMYRQLKGAYGLTWYGALMRTVALVTFAFLAAVLFAIAMVAIGIL